MIQITACRGFAINPFYWKSKLSKYFHYVLRLVLEKLHSFFVPLTSCLQRAIIPKFQDASPASGDIPVENPLANHVSSRELTGRYADRNEADERFALLPPDDDNQVNYWSRSISYWENENMMCENPNFRKRKCFGEETAEREYKTVQWKWKVIIWRKLHLLKGGVNANVLPSHNQQIHFFLSNWLLFRHLNPEKTGLKTRTSSICCLQMTTTRQRLSFFAFFFLLLKDSCISLLTKKEILCSCFDYFQFIIFPVIVDICFETPLRNEGESWIDTFEV